MKYIDLVKNLQNSEKNKGYIVIIKSGIFFVGIGKDAIILNKLLNLKLICMKDNLCKVGFQIKSIEKYIHKLKELDKSFVIYDYDKDSMHEEEIIRFKGQDVFESKQCLNCKDCVNKKETDDEVIERLKLNLI